MGRSLLGHGAQREEPRTPALVTNTSCLDTAVRPVGQGLPWWRGRGQGWCFPVCSMGPRPAGPTGEMDPTPPPPAQRQQAQVVRARHWMALLVSCWWQWPGIVPGGNPGLEGDSKVSSVFQPVEVGLWGEPQADRGLWGEPWAGSSL